MDTFLPLFRPALYPCVWTGMRLLLGGIRKAVVGMDGITCTCAHDPLASTMTACANAAQDCFGCMIAFATVSSRMAQCELEKKCAVLQAVERGCSMWYCRSTLRAMFGLVFGVGVQRQTRYTRCAC